MGRIVRVALIVGGIYVLSPMHGDRDILADGRSLVANPAERAAQATAALCRRDPEGCIAFGMQALGRPGPATGRAGQAAGDADPTPAAAGPTAATTASTRRAPPAADPAANGRIARP